MKPPADVRALWACLLALPLLAAAEGCSKRVKLVPVDGVVKIGGRPAEGIVVQFLPQASADEKRPSSFATTGPDGGFQLMTQDGKPGAVEGRHAVLLIDSLEERPAQGTQATRPPRLDQRYMTVAGGLSATVAENGGSVELAVPSFGAAP